MSRKKALTSIDKVCETSKMVDAAYLEFCRKHGMIEEVIRIEKKMAHAKKCAAEKKKRKAKK